MKAKYAIKALAYLAAAPVETPVLISEIAESEGIPQKFLELILRELRQHGLVASKRGRFGGYLLSREAKDINIAEIIRIADGPIAPVSCLSKTAYRRCAECQDEATCGVRLILRDAHEASLRVLEGTTLADYTLRSPRNPVSANRYAI